MRRTIPYFIAFFLGALVAILTFVSMNTPPVQAAPVDVEDCEHVATADTIEIYYCQDIGLYVNQLGFMVFEP